MISIDKYNECKCISCNMPYFGLVIWLAIGNSDIKTWLCHRDYKAHNW
jgi:hypothetical protein